jgi:MscS family membrane protein
MLSVVMLLCPALRPQLQLPGEKPTETKPEPPKDTLGRTTPRGTVLGFLTATHKGNDEIAALYLNSPLRGPAAQNLARQLAEVLDRRLPARLNKLSDEPEGSVPDPLKPDEDLVGTISTSQGDLDITLERVDRGKMGRVWLFSRKTLDAIPGVFQELSTPAVEKFLPAFLVKTQFANVPLFEWLAVFLGLPALYSLTGLLNRVASWGTGALRRRLGRDSQARNPQVLPHPLRLLLLAVIIRWLLSSIGLSLLARQFWSTASLIIAIAACVWLLLMLNGFAEQLLLRRRRVVSGSASVLRLTRRLIDSLVLIASFLFTLHHFGVNVTAALAGLGVGGIAVALAAQKTLENVIGGVSLIVDQAVRVGDFLKLGDVSGTVEDVGLRSTRIRTLDRTLVSVPNGQIANMSVETFSVRDKFWFHHIVGLLYETTPEQMRSIIAGVRNLLAQDSRVEADTVRVRFLRLGVFSLDVDIFAYLLARDWNDFLQIQEDLLLRIMDTVYEAGTGIAFPTQTMHLSTGSPSVFTTRSNAESTPEDGPMGPTRRAKSA